MRGEDFLAVAAYLEPLETEASLRNQIGRLYYAAYFEARAWCEVNLGYQRIRLGREHTEVPRLLSAFDSQISDDPAFLRTYRNTADYEFTVSLETLTLQFADAHARTTNVIDCLGALSPP
jgi:hypothetical protein